MRRPPAIAPPRVVLAVRSAMPSSPVEAQGRLTRAVRETIVHLPAAAVAVCAHAANHVILPHEHPALHLCLPLDGCWCEHCARDSHMLERGWGFTLAAGASHGSYTGVAGSRCLHVTLDADHPDVARLARAVTRDGSRRHAAPPAARLRLVADEILAADPWSRDTVPVLLDELLETLDAPMRVTPARRGHLRRTRVSRALRLIVERHRAPLALAEVAEAAGMSGAELVRAFRGLLGTTPGDILRRHRAATARAELARLGTTRSAAAHRAGFADLSHMTRTLRTLGH